MSREKAMEEWKKGRDNFAAIRSRNVELELENDVRKLQVYRIWERGTKTGFQLTNNQNDYPEKWIWFSTSRIVSITVEAVQE